ncbi:SDR family oxidoreductase [Belnapia sp. T6]|uniref:SDR family oxidoreductase n=1 Tax=Belnapia mucosa TaxID=2804532 RepID=A0ABS1V153_9PROT|nr:SDR family oxidoreductase [Belnapia mucosa]MBL6455307.1 SDR family oxidoreductase [Belnapia mucosa]
MSQDNPYPADLFAGEVALVTGAGSGIGRGIAEWLARCGAMVLASDLDPARGEAAVAALRAAGGRAEFLQADLASENGHAALAEAAAAQGPVAMLVHSASPPRPERQTVGAVTAAEWDAMANTNLRSGFFLARAIGQRMVQAGLRGRMIFIASLHAETPRNLPHYSAAKAGQVMLVRELARYFGPAGIRVNGVAPGAIPGGGFQGDFAALARKVPMGRVGSAEDIARAAIPLLSDRCMPYVTGAVLPVDGGLALGNWIDPASALDD